MKNNNTGRLKWLDKLRGAAIFLVVLGHITLSKTPQWYSVMHDIIYSFHMPLFFAISGFLFGYVDWGRKAGFIIKKKVISLGLPYLLFSVIYILLNVVMQNYIATNTRVQLSAIPAIFYRPVAHYWFIYVLLLFFLMASVLKKNRKLSFLLTICSALFFVAGSWLMQEQMNTLIYKGISFYFAFSCAAGLGRGYKELLTGNEAQMKNFRKGSVYAYILNGKVLKGKGLNAACLAAVLLFLADGIIFYQKGYNELPLLASALNKLILLVLGSLSTLVVVYTVSKIPVFSSILSFLGSRTWYIYLLHSYFLSVARALLGRLNIDSPYFCAGGGILLGIGGPLIISYAAGRLKLMEFLFYPEKYMKEKKMIGYGGKTASDRP